MCTHDSHYGSSWRFAHLHVVFPAGFSFEPVILFRVLAFSGCWSAAEASGPGRGYIYIYTGGGVCRYIYIDIVRPCSKGWSQSQLIKSVFPCFYESEQCSWEGARFQKMTLVKTDTSADHVSKTQHFWDVFLQYVENLMFLISKIVRHVKNTTLLIGNVKQM